MSVAQSYVGTLGPSRSAAIRAAVLFAMAFGLGWAIVENVFGAHLQRAYDLRQIVWMRYAVHLCIVFALWGWRQPSLIWRTGRPVFHMARSFMMLIMPLSFAWALTAGMPASFTWALFWSSPLLIVAIAILWRGERPGALTWAGVVIGLVGVVLVVAPTVSWQPAGLIAPALMALSFSVYVVMTRSLRGEHLQTNLFHTALGPFAVLTFFMPAVWITPSMHDLLMMLGIGGFGFVSLLVLDRAASRTAVSDSAPALYSQVGFVVAIGILLTQHLPSLRVMTGSALIAVAAVLAWLSPGAKEPPTMEVR